MNKIINHYKSMRMEFMNININRKQIYLVIHEVEYIK